MTRRLEHRDRAGHVDLHVVGRVGDGAAHVRLSGEVHHHLRSHRLERAAQLVQVAHVDDVQLGAAAQRLGDPWAGAAAKVIDDRYVVAALKQRIDDMRADEARSPGDKDSHGASR